MKRAHKHKARYSAALFIGMLTSSAAFATTGYFALGYGAKSMGMAGATVALPQDSIAAATNPAGMGLVGERVDVGLRLFSPARDGELVSTSFATGETETVSDGSRNELFPIPNIGFVSKLNEQIHVGVSVYGNGGLNTTYDRNIFDETFARTLAGLPSPPGPPPSGIPAGATSTGEPNTGTLGIDLTQGIIAPTVTYKISNNHTVGLSALFGVQRFMARGLGNFAPLSSDAGSLTNRGADWGYGAGVRVGWIGELHPMVTVGATYATKMFMTEFKKYDGLFAGDFDIPENFAAGIAFHILPELDMTFDYQRIFYGNVNAIANAGPTAAEFGGNISADRRLGASNGIGFGWDDISIYRVGVQYEPTTRWTLRAGYSHNDSPIPNDEVLINILAPGVMEDHLTAGISYRPTKGSEWTLTYMHAFDHTQQDGSTAFLGSPARISMRQNSIELACSLRF